MAKRLLMVSGVAVIALALVWLYLIFPGMAKLPADYSVVYHFEGTLQAANPQTGALGAVPGGTKMERSLTGTGINDADALLLKQVIKFTMAANGAPLSAANPAFAALDSTETYAIDRTTRVNLAGGDKTRSGQFTFPLDVKQETYQYWVATTNSTLPATFIGEETVDGLKVYVFKIDSKGNTSPTNATQKIDVAATIKVEPVSGTPVDSKLTTTVNQLLPTGGSIPALINESHFTQATIDEMVTEGKANKNKILYASVYGFWGAFGLGAVLFLVGMFMKSKSAAA